MEDFKKPSSYKSINCSQHKKNDIKNDNRYRPILLPTRTKN